MKQLNAHELITLSSNEIWSHPVLMSNEEFILVLSDGEVVTKGRRVVLAWYLWQLAVHFPIPLRIDHQFSMGYISDRSIREIRSAIYKDIWLTHRGTVGFDPEKVWEHIYITHNYAYNELITKLDSYVVGISAHEIVELIKHPPIEEAILAIKPTQASIDHTKDVVKHHILNTMEVPKSSIVTLARCGVLDTDQLGQVLVARSYCTEIDSRVFQEPITVGFMRGFRSAYDSSIESRSASKAQLFAKDPLAICEYFNRKLQLVAQTLMKLHVGDCGSKHYLPWELELSELSTMVGIHYTTKELRDQGSDMLFTLTGNDTSLVGQTIYLRTPFGCIDKDRSGVCQVCMGEMSYALPMGVSPGHMAAIQIGEKISQLVLKVKHVDGTSKLDDVVIPEYFEDYMEVCSDGSSLRLHGTLRDSAIILIIPALHAKSLPDIHSVNDVNDLNIPSLTEVKELTFMIGDKERIYMEKVVLPTSMGSRHGYLTAALLDYIKFKGYEIDDSGSFQIDLSDWNVSEAFVRLPHKHINMIDFKDDAEGVLLSVNVRTGLRSYRDTTDALKALSGLIRTKVNINFTWVMTMAYTVSAVDPRNNDYRLTRGGEPHSFCTMHQLMHMRSLGAMNAYQSQEKPWKKPETFVVKNRPPHPMDHYILG